MRHFKKSILAVLALGLMLFGCRPDSVDPSGSASGSKGIAGAFDNSHPIMDSVCKWADTVFFRSADGSFFVNQCVGAGGVAIPCATAQPKWGHFNLYNGYVLNGQTPVNYVDIDFALAPGLMCDFTNWVFKTGNGITIDPNTGLPNQGSDWSSLVVNPLRNEWKISMALDSLPGPCFDMACRMSVVRLRLNGSVNENFRQTLWSINEKFDQTGYEGASNSAYVLHYCPQICLPGNSCPPAQTASVCESVYTGLTCAGSTLNTSTLTADSAGTNGQGTYLWSNGLTTRSITVSPTVSTAYTVTVTKGACPLRIVTFNVNVADISCSISGGNGGNGGNGNGGSGSGSGSGSNHGSGTNGSGHHPGCNHNHSSNGPCNGGNHNYGCSGNAHSGSCNHAGHSYHCSRNHASNRSCNGGHTPGCDGRHLPNASCQTRGGHKYSCSQSHSANQACNSSRGHATGCTRGNHSAYTGCNNGHSHTPGRHGSGSGAGSGVSGGHNSPPPSNVAGVKVCHVPPGNPGGATTVCVSYAQLSQHLSGVCGNGGGNGGNGGSNGSNHGHGGCHGSGGQGSGHHGGSPNCGNGHFSGNHSGCSHGNASPNCANGHQNGNHSNCSHTGGGGGYHSGTCGSNHGSNGNCSHGGTHGSQGSGGACSHNGGHNGCGNGNSGGHSSDYIGVCNSNPCH